MTYRSDYRATEREYFWTLPRVFVAGFLTLALAAVVVFALNYAGLMSYGFFQPRLEAVRRDTMINSRSYTEGTIRELYTLKRQYEASTSDAERSTIVAAARHEFSIFPHDRLPNDLAIWLGQIGG